MITDKGKLIALLAEKTGLPKNQVKQQLDELKDRIRQAAKTGEELNIEGFGTFTGKNGEPDFKPDEQLKTEINQKYAGMKPIELMEAFQEAGAGVPVEQVEAPPKAAPPEEYQETAEKPAAESDKEELTPEEPTPAGPETETSQPVEEPPQEQKKEPEPEPVAASQETDPAQSDDKPEPSPKPKSDQPKKKYRTEPAFAGRENNKWGTIFLAAVVVIGIVAVGWGLYDSGILNGSQDGNWQPQDSVAVTSVPSMSPELTDTLASGNNAGGAEQNRAENVSPNNSNAPYGLMGSVSEEGRNGYTIVLHSFRLRSTVQEIADSLNQQNYRTLLLEGTPGGNQRWRLGIGQFESIEAAQATVDTLPARIQSNYFITRIQ